MARAQRSSARWIALLLGVALVASAAVAYALIRVTTPTNGGDQAVASTQDSVPATVAVSPADATVGSNLTAGSAAASSAAGTTAGGTDEAASGAAAANSSASAPSASASGSSAPVTPPPPTTTPVPSGASPASSAAVPSTVTSQLAGSGVTLPAAWSGRAKITVTVLGNCAGGTSSVYQDTAADLALDLPQNEATAVAPTVTSALPDDEPTLTLGVNAGEVPSLTVYSSAVDDAGVLHRYWQLQLTPDENRTQIHGTLIHQAVDADNPNIMVDAETSLQPCETAGTVGLPRVLAAGSTITGWVSQNGAKLTVHATTTDGKREVTVEVTATRKQ